MFLFFCCYASVLSFVLSFLCIKVYEAWFGTACLQCLQGDVAADGSHPGSVRRWQQQTEAEQQLQAAEEAVNRKDKVRKSESIISTDLTTQGRLRLERRRLLGPP